MSGPDALPLPTREHRAVEHARRVHGLDVPDRLARSYLAGRLDGLDPAAALDRALLHERLADGDAPVANAARRIRRSKR